MQIEVLVAYIKCKIKIVVFNFLLLLALNVQGELVTYPQPCVGSICVNPSPYYSVEVKQLPESWIPSFTYYSPGHAPTTDGSPDPGKSNSWTGFSFSGEVEVKVKLLSGTVNSCVIRPKSRNIISEIISSENAVVFTIKEPGQFTVEFNGSYDHAMMVFANPPESYIPSESSAKLHYFGPGVHDIGILYGDPLRTSDPNNRIINEGDTIYIAGGAYLLGTISCTKFDNNYTRTKNVTILYN